MRLQSLMPFTLAPKKCAKEKRARVRQIWPRVGLGRSKHTSTVRETLPETSKDVPPKAGLWRGFRGFGRFRSATLGFILGLHLLSLMAGGLAGCAWFKKERIGSAEQLAAKGMQEFQDEDYRDALKTFTALKERYPYSRYAILAELKVADAHFYREEYPEAIVAYEDFVRLHPKNEVIPYVLYQIGTCYFEQLLSLDRDQTPTRLAVLAFERLLKSHPASTYSEKAKERIGICRQLLAEHEVYVARFYYKSKHYEAALGRFKGVLSDYLDVLTSNQKQEIGNFIIVCKEKLADQLGPPD